MKKKGSGGFQAREVGISKEAGITLVAERCNCRKGEIAEGLSLV